MDLSKIVGKTYRDKDKLTQQVARHLMLDTGGDDRRSDCIHPSEASHEGWCPRAVYYRIIGAKAGIVKPHSLAMEMVFERGHDSHKKWQHWFWDMGLLKGLFICRVCNLRWWDQSPYECPRCESTLLKYGEVPVESPEFLLAGQADGDVVREGGSVLIEVKTIGTGTLQFEAPNLLKRYTYKHTDEDGVARTSVEWYRLWSGIRRPFPAHLRQGMIYCFCYGRKEIIYIYDPKFITAYPKEFEIKFDKSLIGDVLDDCITVKNALEKGRPPRRPMWATEGCTACKACPYEGECYGRLRDSGPGQDDRPSTDQGESVVGEEGPPTPPKTRVRFTQAPYESDGSRRPPADAVPGEVHPVSRSPRRRAGAR
jgi:hypothetical protein